MAFDLNPVAVTAAPLLRALKAGGWTTTKDLAERAGRHPNHIQRDLKVLTDNGLVGDAEPLSLTPEGEAQLAALDRAGDLNAAGAPSALHADLEPHPLNPRKDFDTPEAEEALDELRISIVKSGLLQPIVVRPRPENGKWWIVAGERRWRAIGQLFQRVAAVEKGNDALIVLMTSVTRMEVNMAHLTATMDELKGKLAWATDAAPVGRSGR